MFDELMDLPAMVVDPQMYLCDTSRYGTTIIMVIVSKRYNWYMDSIRVRVVDSTVMMMVVGGGIEY